MNFSYLMIGAGLLLASSGIAQAERNPTPPPSGIVVHLFGPNSIMSDIAPALGGETQAHPAPAPGTSGQSAGSTANGATAPATNNVETSDDPTWHGILHQMFVVGDPNDPTKPSTGRPGEQPNTQ